MDSSQVTNLLVGSILEGSDPFEGTMPSPRAFRLQAKRRLLNLLAQEQLSESMPQPPAIGESVHIVSNGKYDFATWIPEIIRWIGTADSLWVSTWTLSRPNALDIFAMHDGGLIAKGQVHFLTGLYFKRRETATYTMLLDGLLERGGRYKALENHAKVLLVSNASKGAFFTVEGSANLNANPRLEQYVITNDRALWTFHRDWMEEVFQTTQKNYRSTTTPREQIVGFSHRRAGLGVLSVANDVHSRRRIIRAKSNPTGDEAEIGKFAVDIERVIRHWLPCLPAGCVVTCPPQGASWPRDHFAERLAKAVAGLLAIPFATLLERTGEKTGRGPFASLKQEPFKTIGTAPPAVIVVDDLITSGITMKLSMEAIQAAGAAAYGFGWIG